MLRGMANSVRAAPFASPPVGALFFDFVIGVTDSEDPNESACTPKHAKVRSAAM